MPIRTIGLHDDIVGIIRLWSVVHEKSRGNGLFLDTFDVLWPTLGQHVQGLHVVDLIQDDEIAGGRLSGTDTALGIGKDGLDVPQQMPDMVLILAPLLENRCEIEGSVLRTDVRMQNDCREDYGGQDDIIREIFRQQNGEAEDAARIDSTVHEYHAEPVQSTGITRNGVDVLQLVLHQIVLGQDLVALTYEGHPRVGSRGIPHGDRTAWQ